MTALNPNDFLLLLRVHVSEQRAILQVQFALHLFRFDRERPHAVRHGTAQRASIERARKRAHVLPLPIHHLVGCHAELLVFFRDLVDHVLVVARRGADGADGFALPRAERLLGIIS